MPVRGQVVDHMLTRAQSLLVVMVSSTQAIHQGSCMPDAVTWHPGNDHDSLRDARSVSARAPAAARQTRRPAGAAAAFRGSRRQSAAAQAAVRDQPHRRYPRQEVHQGPAANREVRPFAGLYHGLAAVNQPKLGSLLQARVLRNPHPAQEQHRWRCTSCSEAQRSWATAWCQCRFRELR